MRIRAVHTFEFGVLGTQSFDFKDDWSGDTASRVLLSGSNGCGKSTLLKGISIVWEAFGYWLQHRRVNAGSRLMAGGIALILEQVPFGSPDLILYLLTEPLDEEVFLGSAPEWIDKLKKKYSNCLVAGQVQAGYEDSIYGATTLLLPDDKWLDDWTHSLQKMLVSTEPSSSPNILFLDAEERRWITPTKGVGEMRSENLQQRWLSSYQATNNWDGQVESALLNMKVASEERFSRLVDDMNRFLSGKKILKKVTIGENRLRVQLGNEVTHNIDELSAGERQVLILLYMVERWLEKGGIALIDEPDLFLHPSLISGFLSQLERMVAERDGQLIITSHIPEVWERYETLGKRVTLGAAE